MNLKITTAVLGVLLLCGIAACAFLKRENAALRREITARAEDIARLAEANGNQKTAIAALENDARENAALLAKAETEKAKLRARARRIEGTFREEMKNVATLDANAPWPPGVNNALCLRWLVAENRLPPGYDGSGPANPRNAETDPVARFCAAWNRVTPADSLNWAGALLDHIGELSIDRNAIREKGK